MIQHAGASADGRFTMKRPWSSQSPTTKRVTPGDGSERRVHPRTDVSGLWCDRGQVMDLSARGMRLTSMRRWTEGQVRRVNLTDGKRSLAIVARCVWCRQEGMFSHSIGIAFEPANATEERTIAEIAADHAVALTPIDESAPDADSSDSDRV